jgi:hypothetical protein
MKYLLITLFALLCNFSFSQRLEEVNGKYQSRVEYSVTGRDIFTIFRKCNVFLDTQLPDRQTLAISQDSKIQKFSGIGTHKKYKFFFEVICTDQSFKITFTNITHKSKPIGQKSSKIKEMNEFLVDFCGKMQAFVRYS